MKDKEVIVHEQLSAIQRDRYQTCRQKFMTLDGMQKKGKLWEDLETIRAGVATETAAMARRKLLMNYHWYHDLIMELPPGIQDDRFLAHILLRLRYLAKEFAELGPYRLSKNRLLRVLAHLRPWEREAPDIKKAIDVCLFEIMSSTRHWPSTKNTLQNAKSQWRLRGDRNRRRL
ncbi:uncharacterized protein LOC134195846 isoform X2 [Corticium candelabrum]|uniref:uncharacterized protein LOC134195846 isoform X2 n=1 Tax=Corticium candelabrum TaxID=121492 RepID=UPI002E25BA26|nr:uncharacterized protein LOC134195846 isoform X2 [Corticium candelabrum]